MIVPRALTRFFAPLVVLTLGCSGTASTEPKPKSVGKTEDDKTAEAEPHDPAQGACPSQQAVTHMHAAASYFERGEPTLGRAALAKASALMPIAAERDTGVIWSMFNEITTFGPEQVDAQCLAAEAVRAKLHNWVCLPDSLHEQLHARRDDDADANASATKPAK